MNDWITGTLFAAGTLGALLWGWARKSRRAQDIELRDAVRRDGTGTAAWREFFTKSSVHAQPDLVEWHEVGLSCSDDEDWTEQERRTR